MEAKEFNNYLRDLKVDGRAFDALYDFYYARIIRHLTGDFGKEIAEDVAHDFFVKLITSERQEYIRKPTTWVYTCCDNMAKTLVHKLNREVSQSENQYSSQQLSFSEIHSDLKREIEKLDETSQKLIFLYYWDGYNLEEVSEMLGMNYDAVRKRHSRIISQIKRFL